MDITHTIFDLLAAMSAMAVTVTVHRWRLGPAATKIEQAGIDEIPSLSAMSMGVAIGATHSAVIPAERQREPGSSTRQRLLDPRFRGDDGRSDKPGVCLHRHDTGAVTAFPAP